MDLPRDLRVGWDKMISREMQLEMWKIENQGVRKSLDELAQRYSAPGDEWRRHLPAMPLSLDRGSQTDASELQPVSEMDDERRQLRKELEQLRTESEDALRRQKLYYEAQLSKVGPELRAQAQKQVHALELEMEERLRAVRAACRVQLRNEVARATAQLVRGAGLAEAEVQVDAAEQEAAQSGSQLLSPSAAAAAATEASLGSESREWWTQEREQLLHEAACRLQRQTTTLRRMAARIDQLEDQLAVARIKEESVRLEAQKRGGAVLSSAEAELRLEAVRRHSHRLEAALEARRREAEEAHSEAAELRRQLALVQGCAALRGHWLGATGERLPPLEPQQEEQAPDVEAASRRLTRWSRLATEEAPPTRQPDAQQGETGARSPPPKSAGTRSTDSLEREWTTDEDRQRSVTRDVSGEAAKRQQVWAADDAGQDAAEKGFYLLGAQNQDMWSEKKRETTTESNASGRVTQSTRGTRDAGSVGEVQGSQATDDDADVVTDITPNTEAVANSPRTFSESRSWYSDHRNRDAMGRFRRINKLTPRSQVVHHVVDIEPDFSTDLRRPVPRRSRFGGVVDWKEAVEAGYPLKNAVPSQQISSFTYSTGSANEVWPSSYTEKKPDSALATQEKIDPWAVTEIKGSMFNVERGRPRSRRSTGARARAAKPRLPKSKKAAKLSSETSGEESPDPEPAGASYYERLVERMAGDAGGGAPAQAEGEQAWSASPLHGEQALGVRKSAWRRLRPRPRGSLSEQSASELEEIDRRRQQRQMLEAMAQRNE